MLIPRAGELKGIPIVDAKFFRTRDTILFVGRGANHPISRIQGGVVRPAKIEVGLPVRDKISMFPAETINEGGLPQEEVVLPLAGLLVCVTRQLAPACARWMSPTVAMLAEMTSNIQFLKTIPAD
jgi:hypothetical protein